MLATDEGQGISTPSAVPLLCALSSSDYGPERQPVHSPKATTYSTSISV